MNCNEAAEFVSALCDGERIPAAAAAHVGDCEGCQARLREYIALGAEMRRAASLEMEQELKPLVWETKRGSISTMWQKGWETMRIPRFAFAALVMGIVALGSTLAIVKAGTHSSGTVVLLNTAGADGPFMDCPLSTQDRNHATCFFAGKMNGKGIGCRIDLVNHESNRIELAIWTKNWERETGGHSLDGIETEPHMLVWFEPGEPLKIDVPDAGTLVLTGVWMDHMPILIGLHGQDVSPGPNEIRFGSPLLLKDKRLAGDLVCTIGGVFSTDDLDRLAAVIDTPKEGRFLISRLPMNGAVEAKVTLSRLSFEEGGHSWELISGVPITNDNYLWVLHQPDSKWNAIGQTGDCATFNFTKLVQSAPGKWIPSDPQ
jgi:hypothetical protein